ncbi:MAG TPA: tetratricopeptide repeat protein, partial [Burkholderiaceae bacterium]
MLSWFKKKKNTETKAAAEAPSSVVNAAAKALKEQGDAFLDTAQWQEAAQCYEQALAQEPQFAAVRSNLGFALMQLHRYTDASAQLELALTLDAGLFNAHYLLATIARRQAHIADAVRHVETAIAIRPSFAEAYSLLGDLRLELEDRDGASAAYLRALELDPGAASALSNLGGICEHRGERRKALAYYRQALALEPHNQGMRLNLLHQQFQLADWAGVENEIAL